MLQIIFQTKYITEPSNGETKAKMKPVSLVNLAVAMMMSFATVIPPASAATFPVEKHPMSLGNLYADATNVGPVVTVPQGPLTAPTFGYMYIKGIDVNYPDNPNIKLDVTLSVSSGTLEIKPNVSGGVRPVDITGDGVVGQVKGKVIIVKASLDAIRNTFTAYNTISYQRKPGLKGQDTLIVKAENKAFPNPNAPNSDTKSVIINLK
jgi:hypothetical protein